MSYYDIEQIVQEMHEKDAKNKALITNEKEMANRERLIEMGAFLDGVEDEQIEVDSKNNFLKEATPNVVDLRRFDPAIEQQDNGKCSAFSLTAAMSNMLNQKTEQSYDLSEWHLWSFYKQYSCKSAIHAASRKFIADEKYWRKWGAPQDGIDDNAHATIQKFRFLGDDVDAMVQALSKGHIVYLGMTTPSDMVAGRAVIRPDSYMTDGGHALSIVGFHRDERVPGEIVAIVRNSWGRGTGDEGYQYLPIAHFAKRKDMYILLWEIEEVASKKRGHVKKPKYRCTNWKRNWPFFWKWKCTNWERV